MQNYAVFFGLMGKILYQYPEKDFYKKLIEEEIFDDTPLSIDTPPFIEGAHMLKQWAAQFNGSLDDQGYDDIVNDYQRLFVGTSGPVQAPPWESLYVGPDPMLFQESTLSARRWYAKHGLQAEHLKHEPDDHIGLELIFIAHLISKINQGENELDSLKEFYSEHIAGWAAAWCTLCAEKSNHPLFKAVAIISREALADLGKKLGL
ncbi:MAG: molecular chaperone TorD family protein [Deferribacteraceae bacterium]|jgi:TorA maturation chaperone TorD|nr:molecular chaperone TorD family protein [Deferribacteraceae bacterium]